MLLCKHHLPVILSPTLCRNKQKVKIDHQLMIKLNFSELVQQASIQAGRHKCPNLFSRKWITSLTVSLIFGVSYYFSELVNSTSRILGKAKYQLLTDQADWIASDHILCVEKSAKWIAVSKRKVVSILNQLHVERNICVCRY